MIQPDAPQTPGALSHVRVLEMGSLLAGPFVGRLLGDLGADVIKIEAPDVPDPLRQWGRNRYRGRTLWWPVQSRNKRCITLNLAAPQGQEIFKRLARDSDIVVENFRPGTLEKWGLEWGVLSSINPRLILVRVSGFGQTGPYHQRAGFGSVGEAMGGLRYITGFPDGPPARLGISIGDSLAALFATIGALTALAHRSVSGRGQVVDAAITESVFSLLESSVPEYGRLGIVRERTGNILPKVAPSNVYPTRDGHLVIGANHDNVFRRLTLAMGRPELADDPRFCSHTARGEHQQELDDIISAWTSGLQKNELWAKLNEAGVPAGPIYSIADIMRDAQFLARDMVVTIEDDVIGPIEMPGIVPKLSETPGRVRWSGPAEPGLHNSEVYGQLAGLSSESLDDLRRQGVI